MGRPLKMGGNAWAYLVDSVAGELAQGADAARYYSGDGTPPGRFLGRGLDGLGPTPGSVKVGDEVSPAMLHRMLAQLSDPVTGQALGRLPSLGHKAPVAASDLTFAPSKSVSLMWAMADRETRAAVEEVLSQALSEVISWAEDNVFFTRTGAQGARQEAVRGVVASTWLHYESRDGDPHLHHHAVILNRAQAVSDGRWRTLDSRGLHPWLVPLSERHTGVVEDLMTQRFGVAWQGTRAIAGRVAKREVEGVAPEMVAEFSRRTLAIEQAIDKKVAEAEEARDQVATPDQQGVVHREAWRETRRKKLHRPLSEMTADWAERAPWVGGSAASWAASLAGRSDLAAHRSVDLTDAMLADVARAALYARSEKASVFTQANMYADVDRGLHGVLFAPGERAKVSERSVTLALSMAVRLSPPDLCHVPGHFRAADGTSQFAPANSLKYTTAEVLGAEARLLDAGRSTAMPKASFEAVAKICGQDLPGRTYALGAAQAVAVENVATSGRALDALVGPAGTGKSTALAGLRAVWEAERGAGSVKGLAPSATAAANLAAELGIPTENTAKWLTELGKETSRRAELGRLRGLMNQVPGHASASVSQRTGELEAELNRWRLKPGDLLIVDEASLAGTLVLDRLAAQTGAAGAKLLLVGDWAQAGAVTAGGGFAMLVAARHNVAELSEARRFYQAWERQAGAQLRAGWASAVDDYIAHGRVSEGDGDEVLAACYQSWKQDVEAGKSSLMMAVDLATVTELNRLAHADRVASGVVAADGVGLSDGLVAGAGDVVVARRNDRRLLLSDGEWVRNRDRFVVRATLPDASLDVRSLDGEGEVVLPREYVSEHVELGYATTVLSAQGRTAATAHAVVSTAMTRELLYVAATRGRESNRFYVDIAPEPAGAEMAHGPADRLEARDVLVAAARRRGADVSAHEVMRTEWAKATSFEQLVKEHQSLMMSGVAPPSDLVGDKGTGPTPSRPQGAPSRIGTAAQHHTHPDMVAGLVPRASRIVDDDMAKAVNEREDAIASRARGLAELAVGTGAAWAKAFGPPPRAPAAARAWWDRLAVIAAYRDRWGVSSASILGTESEVSSWQQAAHRGRARQAGQEAARLAGLVPPVPSYAPAAPVAQLGPDVDI